MSCLTLLSFKKYLFIVSNFHIFSNRPFGRSINIIAVLDTCKFISILCYPFITITFNSHTMDPLVLRSFHTSIRANTSESSFLQSSWFQFLFSIWFSNHSIAHRRIRSFCTVSIFSNISWRTWSFLTIISYAHYAIRTLLVHYGPYKSRTLFNSIQENLVLA